MAGLLLLPVAGVSAAGGSEAGCCCKAGVVKAQKDSCCKAKGASKSGNRQAPQKKCRGECVKCSQAVEHSTAGVTGHGTQAPGLMHAGTMAWGAVVHGGVSVFDILPHPPRC